MSNKLNSELITKAVKELVKHDTRKKNDSKNVLIEGFSTPIAVQIQLQDAITKPVVRPIRIKIPNSMFSVEEEEHSICFFCRSEDKESLEEYLAANPFDGLTSVVSLGDINKEYKAFKDRKELMFRHTHFVCDVAIVSHLYNLLGKVFTGANHHPVPITVKKTYGAKSNNKLHANIQQVVDSTYMHLKGQHITLKFGNVRMPVAETVANIVDGLTFAIETKLKDGWKSIHSLHIKTPLSAALPLYYKNGNDLMKMMTVESTKAKTVKSKEAVIMPPAPPAPVKTATKATAKTGAKPTTKASSLTKPTSSSNAKSKKSEAPLPPPPTKTTTRVSKVGATKKSGWK